MTLHVDVSAFAGSGLPAMLLGVSILGSLILYLKCLHRCGLKAVIKA